jgi:hypothetical protein
VKPAVPRKNTVNVETYQGILMKTSILVLFGWIMTLTARAEIVTYSFDDKEGTFLMQSPIWGTRLVTTEEVSKAQELVNQHYLEMNSSGKKCSITTGGLLTDGDDNCQKPNYQTDDDLNQWAVKASGYVTIENWWRPTLLVLLYRENERQNQLQYHLENEIKAMVQEHQGTDR